MAKVAEENDHRDLSNWSNVNDTNGTIHLTKDMVFNDGHRLSITVYRWVEFRPAFYNLVVKITAHVSHWCIFSLSTLTFTIFNKSKLINSYGDVGVAAWIINTYKSYWGHHRWFLLGCLAICLRLIILTWNLNFADHCRVQFIECQRFV